MSQLVLALCLAFEIYCIVQDHKEYPRLTKAAWVPFIWLVLCSSKPITLWLNPALIHAQRTELSSIEGNPIERAFFILLILAGLFILSKRRGRFFLSFKDNAAFFLFVFFILLSALWAPYPDIVLKRWLRAVGDIVMVLVILTEDDQAAAVEHLLRRCAIVLIPLSFVYIRFFGHIGINYSISGERMWTGVTTNKNELGFLCAYMGIFFVWRLIKAWPRIVFIDGLYLALILYLLRGARSMTSATVFVLGVVMLIFFMRLKGDPQKIRRTVLVSLVLLVVLQGLSVGLLEKSLPSVFLSMTGRNETLTGRTPLWQGLIEIGSKNPISGSGFGNFWAANLKLIWSRYAFHPIQGHNGYLDVFLDLGLVGLILLLLVIVRTYRKTVGGFGGDWPYRTLLLVFFVMVLVHNFTEASIAKPTNLLWALFLLSAVCVKTVTGAEVAADRGEPVL